MNHALTTNTNAHDLAHGKARLSPLARLLAIYRREAELSAAESDLKSLDDRLLADIGISRSEISAVLRGKATRR